MVATLNISGLIFNLAGVILLFLFGMPFRIRTEGKHSFTYMLPDFAKTIHQELIYSCLGWVGLVLIVLGTALQVAASLA